MTRKTIRLLASTGALVLLAGGLLAVRAADDKKKAEAATDVPKALPKLAAFDAADLRTIEITNANGGVTLTSADGDTWLVDGAGPYFKVDQSLAQATAKALANIQPSEEIADAPDDPGAFGLDPPAAGMRITSSDGTTVRLEVGASNPAGSGRYARLAGDTKVYLVPLWQTSKALSTPDDYRDKSLPAPDAKSIVSFELKTADKRIVAVPHAKDDPYEVLSPTMDITVPWKGRYAVSYKFDELLQNNPPPTLIMGFMDGHPADDPSLGLGPDADRLTLTDDKGITLDLVLGDAAPDGNRYAALAGQEGPPFTVSASALGLLDAVNAVDITEKALFLPGLDKIRSAVVDYPGGRLDLQIERRGDPDSKDDDLYTVNGQSVPRSDFSDGYQKLIGLRWDSPIPKAVSLGQTEVRIRYTHVDDGVAPVDVRFWPYDRDFYVAAVAGQPAEFLITREKVNDMITALEALSHYGS